MKKERKEDSFIKKPFYKGGEKELHAFVSAQLVYPEQAKALMLEGDVYLRYEINHKGDVSDVKVIGGVDESCNEESIRVVKMLKFEVPKNPRKLRVTFHRTIRIKFRLGKPAMVTEMESEPKLSPPQNVSVSYQYSFSSAPKTEPKDTDKKPISYNYTITVR